MLLVAPEYKGREIVFLSIYKPPSINIQYLRNSLSNIINYHSNAYGNQIVISDFDLEPFQMCLETFMETHNYFNLTKNNTCLKEPWSCFDLILTNRKCFFQGTSSFEAGLRDIITLFLLHSKVHLKRKNLNKLSIVIYKHFQ